MKYIAVLLLTLGVTTAQAEAIARMQNTGGGYIVLTDEPCVYKRKDYAPLKRSYTYTAKGNTFDGCYGIEDDTVLVVWLEANEQRRYPITSFEIIARGNRL